MEFEVFDVHADDIGNFEGLHFEFDFHELRFEDAAFLGALGDATEFQRHLDADALVGIDAHQVDVLDEVLEMIILHGLDEHFFALAVEDEFHGVGAGVDDGGGEWSGEGDGDGVFFEPVEDARDAAAEAGELGFAGAAFAAEFGFDFDVLVFSGFGHGVILFVLGRVLSTLEGRQMPSKTPRLPSTSPKSGI